MAQWCTQRVIVKEELTGGGPRGGARNAIILAVTPTK